MEPATQTAEASTFLPPAESIGKLDRIADQLRNWLNENKSPRFIAAGVYYLTLRAQKKILAHMNDDNFSCQVFWDSRTGLPSHPSLVADVSKSAEIFSFPAELKVLLNSLSGWTLLKEEKMRCCCGSKERVVVINVMMNTILKAGDDGLTVKFFVGVKTDDHNHFEHYNFKRQSRVENDLYIVFECENLVRINSEEITIEMVNFRHAEYFGVSELEKTIQNSVNLLAES